MKLKDKLDLLRTATPNCSRFGQLHKDKSETLGAWKRVNFHTLFISSENTHLIRSHVFQSDHKRTAEEWAAWFGEHLSRIHSQSVLPGLALRTGKQWSVEQLLGWVPDVKHKSTSAAVGSRRNKAQSKGRKNG